MVAGVSLLRFLGLEREAASAPSSETATVRRIVDALDRLEPELARYIARFAFVLGRVAHADLAVSADETRAMERIVMERGHLPEEQAVIVVQIAKSQNALFGGTESYLVTRELASTATREQKLALLDCCFAVSAADRDVSGTEDIEIRKIASALGLEHGDFIAARSANREYLALFRQRATGQGMRSTH
jgi:uncharacterized tellurite resistance protein B-like protein